MTAERWRAVKPVLAAILDADEADRAALLDSLCGSDLELRRAVEALLAMEGQASDVLDSAGAPGAALRADVRAPETIGAYRILSEIGRGGMGVVYVAERGDGEYQKRVAIKLITSGMRHAGLERRFRRERQILAQLEHPGIARLLDGGATAEGQPYFVMEHVDGLPLLAHSEAAELDVTARLRLFVEICDAVAYAHGRLVVHRDLKPGNILITPDGRSKLLDFGLARVIEEGGGDLAETAAHAMTPAYASPEQIRGEPDSVAGDVYSLGVILYELLAGRRPYRDAKTLAQLARAIVEETPAPLAEAAPTALRKRVAGDLETIVAKSLEKDARRRYATVAELAADVRRHLDGVPVLARPATLPYRVGKLIRRHRVAVPAAAAALLLILGSAGAALWEARRAQRRFEQVRSLAHSVLFELHDAIERLPGSTGARELLVRRALEYLENLSRESGGNAGVAREVALGYERVGIVQGFLGDSNLGKVAPALESFRRADEILSRLAVRDASLDLLRDRLRVANELAAGYSNNARFEEARAVLRRNIAAYEEARRHAPGDASWGYGLAVAEGSLADTLTEEKRYGEAIPWREKALAHTREAEGLTGGAAMSRALAIAEKRLGALYGVEKRYEECRREYEEARAIDERRLAAAPQDTQTMLDVSYDYSDLGWVQGRLGRWPEAIAAYRRTLGLRKQAAEADPRDQRAAVSLAGAADKLGTSLHSAGDLAGSVQELERSLAAYQLLVDSGSNDWNTVRNLAEVHVDLAETLTDAGDRPRAAAEYREARRIYTGLRDRGVLPAAYVKEIDELAAAEAAVVKQR